MWARVNLTKDGEILKIFETVQAPVSNLKFRDQESMFFFVTSRHRWSLNTRIANRCSAKSHVFSDSVLCLGGNVLTILMRQEFGKTIASRDSVESPKDRPYYDTTGKTNEICVDDLRGRTRQSRSSNAQ